MTITVRIGALFLRMHFNPSHLKIHSSFFARLLSFTSFLFLFHVFEIATPMNHQGIISMVIDLWT